MIASGPVIVLAAALLEPGVAGSPSPLPERSICDVVANWRDHHGKAVRVTGSYHSGFERSSLSGPGCRGAWVTWAGARDPRLAEAVEKSRGRGRFTGLAVVFEGVFRGPEPRPDGSAARYGHLGGFAAQLEVTKVVGFGKAAAAAR